MPRFERNNYKKQSHNLGKPLQYYSQSILSHGIKGVLDTYKIPLTVIRTTIRHSVAMPKPA